MELYDIEDFILDLRNYTLEDIRKMPFYELFYKVEAIEKREKQKQDAEKEAEKKSRTSQKQPSLSDMKRQSGFKPAKYPKIPKAGKF